jgi:hypothetical protein
LLSAVLLATGCSEDGDASRESRGARSAESPAGDETTPSDAQPDAGEVRLRVEGRKLTLTANAAPRRPLLERLARELSFELVAPDVADEPITLRAESAELRDVLPRLLPHRPYRVDYRFDAVNARHEIARLEVGVLGASAMEPRNPAALPDGDAPTRAEESAARARSDDERPHPGTQLQHVTRTGRDWSAILQQLDDSDPEERVEALEQIVSDAKGRDVLIERLANDPSPLARAAAARQLEAETLTEVDALIRALGDPDRRVVLEAIDALEFTDDESVADDLEPLTRHSDPEIAEAASDARCFIRDCD